MIRINPGRHKREKAIVKQSCYYFYRETYELRMCMNPTYSHQILGNLAFEQLDFVVHGALVLLSCLCRYD